MKRPVFILSDGTGITVEKLAHSLLSQFDGVEFQYHNFPFVDTPERAREIVAIIDQVASVDQVRPLLFCSLIDSQVHSVIRHSQALLIDYFEAFIGVLETELQIKSSHTLGRSHGIVSDNEYKTRINAVNYALAYDDGMSTRGYDTADIVLTGVSRSGKTPTCLYMALHYGLSAANYPLTEDDFHNSGLPAILKPYRAKLFGLTIEANRLHRIRSERRPDSRYASIEQCRFELEKVEQMYRRENIPYLETTVKSIEEIATTIMAKIGLQRHVSN